MTKKMFLMLVICIGLLMGLQWSVYANWVYQGETTANPACSGSGGISWNSTYSYFEGGGSGSGTFSWGSDSDYQIVWKARKSANGSPFVLGGYDLSIYWSYEYTTYGRTLTWSGSNGVQIDYVKVYHWEAATPTPTPSPTATPTISATVSPTATPTTTYSSGYWVYEGETTVDPVCSGSVSLSWSSSVNNFIGGGGGSGSISWGSDLNYKIMWRARKYDTNYTVILDGNQMGVDWSMEYTTYGRTLSAYTNSGMEVDYVRVYRWVAATPTPTPTPTRTGTWVYQGETTDNPTVYGSGGLSWYSYYDSFKGGAGGTGTYSWGDDTNYMIKWRARKDSPDYLFVLDGNELTTDWSWEYTTMGRTLPFEGYTSVEIDYIKVYHYE